MKNKHKPLDPQELSTMMTLTEENHRAYTDYDLNLNKPWKKVTSLFPLI